MPPLEAHAYNIVAVFQHCKSYGVDVSLDHLRGLVQIITNCIRVNEMRNLLCSLLNSFAIVGRSVTTHPSANRMLYTRTQNPAPIVFITETEANLRNILTKTSVNHLHKSCVRNSISWTIGHIKGKEADSDMSLILKTPKGMRDIGPAQAWQRKKIFEIITEIFELHGALPLDTPVCERRDILANKYGEESKLIYNLDDQGGEALSLRYDLTVPFARYLGQNKIQALTRYHIAKVYRRDNPSINKGRFREFYQCDIDFAGKYDPMMSDTECLEILCEILKAINLPYEFTIKVNHRLILNGMFQVCGVPQEKFKSICSAVDKLDKLPWEDVKREMCIEKGLDESVADKIGLYVARSGGVQLIEQLLQEELGHDQDAKNGLEDMKLLFKNATSMDISKHLKFDLSLARGLDYYTGLIFEALVSDVEVGSIAAGGRYDNLVSGLLENPNFQVPCVGLSVGIERLFAILESQKQPESRISNQSGESQIHCCVGSIGKEMSAHRYKIISELRKQGIRVKNVLKDSVKPLVLYQTCEKDGVPYAIFFGPTDIEKKVVCLRKMSTREDEKIPVDELADLLQQRLNIKNEKSRLPS